MGDTAVHSQSAFFTRSDEGYSQADGFAQADKKRMLVVQDGTAPTVAVSTSEWLIRCAASPSLGDSVERAVRRVARLASIRGLQAQETLASGLCSGNFAPVPLSRHPRKMARLGESRAIQE